MVECSYVISSPSAQIAKINGKYLRFRKAIGAGAGMNWREARAAAMPNHSKIFLTRPYLNRKDYNLKFEVNTVKPYNANMLKINVV
jgi:hypothetical protein